VLEQLVPIDQPKKREGPFYPVELIEKNPDEHQDKLAAE
jgi:hypothetical protein